jgi:hypothetical protein
VNEKIVETPQYLFMRVAVGIHKEDVGAAIEVKFLEIYFG